jgi:hypothetical protein
VIHLSRASQKKENYNLAMNFAQNSLKRIFKRKSGHLSIFLHRVASGCSVSPPGRALLDLARCAGARGIWRWWCVLLPRLELALHNLARAGSCGGELPQCGPAANLREDIVADG